jgi:hypothetical protein
MFCPTEACGVQAADVGSAQQQAGLIGGVSLSGRDAAVSHLADKVRVGLLTPARRARPRAKTLPADMVGNLGHPLCQAVVGHPPLSNH